MVKKVVFLLSTLLFIVSTATPVFASENPLAVPNNKFGIHILFNTDLDTAAKLVNSNGGKWGYVVIPIQASDMDLTKWQSFMDEAKKQHVIPIIRLATEGDYFNKTAWRKPTDDDVIDFANFLNSLTWPTKNRYVIVFNEVNRADEWGGSIDPAEYANLLSYAVTVFKSKSQDFFLLNAGLDNAAPDNPPDYMNEYTYLTDMNAAVPGIFKQLDGFDSHSYPNPGFAEPPTVSTNESIDSFSYEENLLKSFGTPDLPVFITETGWDNSAISDTIQTDFYKQAFSSVWSDPNIVVVAPFLLTAGAGPFAEFSFLNTDGTETPQYKTLAAMPKVAGQPKMVPAVLAANTNIAAPSPTWEPPVRDFSAKLNTDSNDVSLAETAQKAFNWVMKI